MSDLQKGQRQRPAHNAAQQGTAIHGMRRASVKHASRRHMRQQRQFWRRMRYVRLAGVAAVLFVAITAFAVVGIGRLVDVSQGSGVNTGPRLTPEWVTLTAPTPAAVRTAAQQTALYRATYNAPQTALGHILRTGSLGTPVFVHAYRPTPGMTDVWVIPVYPALSTQPRAQSSSPRQHAGAAAIAAGFYPLALLDFAYDAHHHRIRPLTFAGPFVATDPEYHQPFPRLSSAQALAFFSHALSVRGIHPLPQAGVAGVTGSSNAQLVYFPLNLDATLGPHPTATWTAGGAFPDTAIWLAQGSNGQAYFIAADGRVIPTTQAPFAPDAAAC